MSYRGLLVIALVAGLPGMAAAQFTTFIPPRSVAVDSVAAAAVAVVATPADQADSVVNMQLTNMKTWVDSAAGIAAAPTTMADSLAIAVAVVSADTALITMPNGIPAPATASALPLLALLGAATLSAGLVLLARPKPAPERD